MRRATRLLAVVVSSVVAVVAVVGCASKSVGKSPFAVATTTTGPPPALTAGHGYLQLGGTYYPFDVAACGLGILKADPPTAQRVFGVYANGYTQGQLFTIDLTRYRAVASVASGPATITDTAEVRMQGGTKAKPIVIGLRSQRARLESSDRWVDKLDPTAQSQLITTVGRHYSLKSEFGPQDAQAGDPGILAGRVEVVCPDATGADSGSDTGSPSTAATGTTSTTLPTSSGSPTSTGPSSS